MIIYMDMGTSSTRLWLTDGELTLAAKKERFGASLTLSEGHEALVSRLRELISALLAEANADESDVAYILASGMASSELGLAEVPHLPAPAGLDELKSRLFDISLPAITSIRFRIVPGVKMQDENGRIADMMRGEETETVGLCDLLGLDKDAILILPGTHNKIILIQDGKIVSFATSMSGELLGIVSDHSILRGNLDYDFALDEKQLDAGMRWAVRHGLGSALFHVRVMSKNGDSKDAMSSFAFGAIFSQDVMTARALGASAPVYVGGKQSLRMPLCRLLDGDCREIPDEYSALAVKHGLEMIGK